VIGLALGGEAGQRTVSKLGITVSADTLLRRVRSIPDSVARGVRVLVVDDFAFRRGYRYGTILVDQEAHRPIDLLPNREATTLRTWLQEHHEIQIITRDRSLAYAEAARSGAPRVSNQPCSAKAADLVETIDNNHGRRETRRVYSLPAPEF
jgi:transposase